MEASALQAPAGLGRLSVTGPLLRLRTDEQLVALFRAGHEEAFRVIHDRYRVRLFAYARQMLGGSRTDAEDALQDVFLRAYHALRADDRPVTLRAWLYRVAHNRCIDQLRRPTPAAADVFEVNRTRIVDPTDEAERREDLRRLVADVRRLPEQQRSALLMRELEGLSYADLASALGVTVPAVKSLLVRARMGLVEAAEARSTACCEIREDLAEAIDRGVRTPARARRHLRECDGCRDFRDALRGADRALAGLGADHGLLTTFLKLLGIGGGGAAAGAGGGAAAGGAAAGGGAAVLGGGAAKLAAVVCCAAVVGGGAVEVERGRQEHDSGTKALSAAKAPAASAAAAAVPAAAGAARAGTLPDPASGAARRRAIADDARGQVALPEPQDLRPAPYGLDGLPTPVETASGGVAAPDDPTAPAVAVPAPEPETPASPGEAIELAGTPPPAARDDRAAPHGTSMGRPAPSSAGSQGATTTPRPAQAASGGSMDTGGTPAGD